MQKLSSKQTFMRKNIPDDNSLSPPPVGGGGQSRTLAFLSINNFGCVKCVPSSFEVPALPASKPPVQGHRQKRASTEHFPEGPETFQTVRNLSNVSRNFPEIPKTFQRFLKLSRDSRNFREISETLQRFQKLSRVSENFQEVSETCHSVQKISRVSGKFCRVSVNFPKSRNFPGYPETFQSFQKLS